MVHVLVLVVLVNVLIGIEQRTGISMFASRLHGGAEVGTLLSFAGPWGMDLAALLYVSVVLLLASRTYAWIEVPARARFNRWARERIEQARADAGAFTDLAGAGTAIRESRV